VNLNRKAVIVSIVFLALFSVSRVAANSRIFDIKEIDPLIENIEYKIEGEGWSSVDINDPRIELTRPPVNQEELLIKQYYGGKIASSQMVYRYDEAIGTWVHIPHVATKVSRKVISDEEVEMILSPYALLMLTDSSLRHMYTLPAGVGANFSLSFPFHRPLIFGADLELSFVKSNNIWATSFINVGTGLGIGYRFLLGESFVITPTLSYRLYFQTGLNSILEMETPVFMTHHLGLDVAVSYRFTTNMSVFISPRAELLLDGIDSGFLYGLHAGVGFVL
jgi:hypothetical protein